MVKQKSLFYPLSLSCFPEMFVCWSWSTLAGPWWRSIRLWQLVWPVMSWWSSAGTSGQSCMSRDWCRATSAVWWVNRWQSRLISKKISWLFNVSLNVDVCTCISWFWVCLTVFLGCWFLHLTLFFSYLYLVIILYCISFTGVIAVPAVCHRVSQLLHWIRSLIRRAILYNQIK